MSSVLSKHILNIVVIQCAAWCDTKTPYIVFGFLRTLHYVVHIWMPEFTSSSALYLCTCSALASPHLLLLGDWSGNMLPTTKQSKFNLLTVKRLFFRNHTTWPQPLSSWLFSSFTLSVTPNMINWLSMCLLHFLLLTAFFSPPIFYNLPTLLPRCLLLLSRLSTSQTGSVF